MDVATAYTPCINCMENTPSPHTSSTLVAKYAQPSVLTVAWKAQPNKWLSQQQASTGHWAWPHPIPVHIREQKCEYGHDGGRVGPHRIHIVVHLPLRQTFHPLHVGC